jgi:hypothetical protein
MITFLLFLTKRSKNMKFKSKLSLFLGALMIAGASFAADDLVCPTLESIKSEGIPMTEMLLENLYITYNASSYTTEKLWIFGLGPVEADSKDASLINANEILANMSSQGVPRRDPTNSGYLCTYNTNTPNVLAAAAFLEAGPMPRVPSALKNYLSRT